MMRTIHALLTAPALALALGASPAGAATLPTADEAQKIVSQAVNARATTAVVCSANKQNILSKSLVDHLRDLAYGRVRAGEDGEQSALADYTFTVAPSVFGDGMLKINKHADPMLTADPLVNVPAHPVFLSYYVENLKKPFNAQAKLKLDGGVWHVVP